MISLLTEDHSWCRNFAEGQDNSKRGSYPPTEKCLNPGYCAELLDVDSTTIRHSGLIASLHRWPDQIYAQEELLRCQILPDLDTAVRIFRKATNAGADNITIILVKF